jgi:competence protein ComEC
VVTPIRSAPGRAAPTAAPAPAPAPAPASAPEPARAPLGYRVDAVLVAVVCLALGAAAAVAPAAALATAALGLWALRRQLGARALGVAVLCLGVGGGRACARLAEHARAQADARALLPAPGRCAAHGRVTSSPAQLAGKLRFDAELDALDCDGRLDARAWPTRLYVASPTLPIERGSDIAVIADLAPVSDFRNFDLPDPRPASARRGAVLSGAAVSLEVTRRSFGPRALIDRARSHVRGRLIATFAPLVTGMARALVLGENDLDPADERAFQRSGLSHLLAVSGTHLILAVLALVRALEALLKRWLWLAQRTDVRRPAALLGLCLGPLYADFAGGSGSAWRAAWMLCAVLGVRALGRHVFASRVLAAALGAGWLEDSLVVFDPSFSLSMAATVGLLVLGRRLNEDLLARTAQLTEPRATDLGRFPKAITHAALTTLAATLPCTPILLSLSPGLSLTSVAANLLAAPLGEAVALPLCLAHAVSAPWPALENGIALAASGALTLIRAVAWAAASVDWLYFELPPPNEWHLAVLAAAIPILLAPRARTWLSPAADSAPARARAASITGATRRSPRALVCALSLLLVEAATRFQHSPTSMRLLHRLRVTALDVGQGDATLIDLPDGRLMLIDGGGFVGAATDPGERVILPTLRARRREHLDIVVLTHPHPDHFGGLLSVARQVSIGELWYGGSGVGSPAPAASGAAPSADPPAPAAREAPPLALRELLRALAQAGIPLRGATELCQHMPDADRGLQVLHPCPSASEHGQNDNSLVLRIAHGRRAALLVGDAERWAEARLLATHPNDLHADFLKVGHHGSRTSSSGPFLAHVAATFASISCGVRNRFGHPHPEALARLTQAGALPLPLDRLGAVQWQTNGDTQTLRTRVGGELTEGSPRY